MAATRTLPGWRHWALALLIAAAGAMALYAMGRLPICACGTVKLWHGVVYSSENSQHLTDWYSPTHVLHGLLFYMALHWLAPRWSLGPRLVAATLLETGWEIAENTDAMIERYREATVALDYFGDSIVNSTADITMMWLGFLIASRAPVLVSVALFVITEVLLGLAIRDGLTLNIVMLIWPLDAILAWQQGG
ncbi:MAG: DUF2585 family protein [Alphaproteobacteria bacterium]